jgi:hypothetical protein
MRNLHVLADNDVVGSRDKIEEEIELDAKPGTME